MTKALCLFCGGSKFGALNPCPDCQSGSTGNMNLDILFSDHHLHSDTIDQLGQVIKTINVATQDADLRQQSFLVYVSENHPGVWQVSPDAAWAVEASAFLRTLSLPPVELRPGRQGLPNLEEGLAERRAQSQRRPWWQFWKRSQPP
jgi:hypothetical protein